MSDSIPALLRLPVVWVYVFFLGLPAAYAALITVFFFWERRRGYVQRRFEAECLIALAAMFLVMAIALNAPIGVTIVVPAVLLASGLWRLAHLRLDSGEGKQPRT